MLIVGTAIFSQPFGSEVASVVDRPWPHVEERFAAPCQAAVVQTPERLQALSHLLARIVTCSVCFISVGSVLWKSGREELEGQGRVQKGPPGQVSSAVRKGFQTEDSMT
eukprot:4446516-Amphidinium_carterae.1